MCINQARTWLGTKYHHQGRLKKSPQGSGGVDCIGLVLGVIDELNICGQDGRKLSFYDELGYSMQPEGNRLIEAMRKHLQEIAINQMQIADILVFRTFRDPQHIGLLSQYPTGSLGIIHCNSSAGMVVEQPLSATWQRMISHVFRFYQLSGLIPNP